MSICLLCYAFPFYVSAITLARSELSPLSDLSCSYVSFPFFTPSVSSPPLRPYSISFSLSYFRCLSALLLSGFSPATGSLSACNGSPNCHALLFPLYSLGRHSAKSSISPHVTTLFPLSLFFYFLQAAKLNYVRFENFCALFFTLFPLLRLIGRLVQHALFRAPQRLSILNSL
jgi:hypothetical protein